MDPMLAGMVPLREFECKSMTVNGIGMFIAISKMEFGILPVNEFEWRDRISTAIKLLKREGIGPVSLLECRYSSANE